VDEMSWDDLSKNSMLWPAVSAVTLYRRKVFNLVRNLILDGEVTELPMPAPVDDSHPSWGLFMAFEHERIHIETSSVLIRELPLHLLRQPAAWPAYHPSALRGEEVAEPQAGVHYPTPVPLSLPAGVAVLGKPRSFPSFGWDNEYGSRSIGVAAFSTFQHPVCNGAFHRFVRSGGYAEPRFWSEEGWRWRAFRNTKCPPFWVLDGPQGLHKYRLRLLFHTVPLPWALPCIVNVHEARAYAAWLSETEAPGAPPFRLLSEPEHHLLRNRVGEMDAAAADEVTAFTGEQLALLQVANTNLAFGSECAVDEVSSAATPSGAMHAMGNVWEWCEDTFAALPGFRPHRVYEDFSTPCFDGEHNLIAGGSFASTGDMCSRFARFQFRPHFTQHSGFRLVSSSQPPILSSTDAPPPYAAGWVPPSSTAKPGKRVAGGDDATLLSSFAADAEALAPHLSLEAQESPLAGSLRVGERLAALLAAAVAGSAAASRGEARALVVGSGAGATAFALAESPFFASVLGLEHSLRLVTAAEKLRCEGELRISRQDGSAAPAEVAVQRANPDAARRLAFRQVDPSCLPPDLGGFEGVLLDADMLSTSPSPRGCLGRMGGPRGLVRLGGLVCTASSYAWDENVTPRSAWLCDPSAASCAAELLAALDGVDQGAFTLLSRTQLPSLVRVSAREFTLRVLEVCLFRRER